MFNTHFALIVAALVIVVTTAYPEQTCRDRSKLDCDTPFGTAHYIFDELNELTRQLRHNESIAAWNFNVNVTTATQNEMIAVATANAVEKNRIADRINDYLQNNYLSNERLLREARRLNDTGSSILPEHNYKELKNAIMNMQTNYATTTVCSFTNASDCGLNLEPDILERFVQSRDPAELAYYWQAWHDKAGTPMRDNFTKYVKLSNRAAMLNKFDNYADYWIHFYEDEHFEANLDAAYNAILPLYRQLHGYVRYRLRQHYGPAIVPEEGNIPMHLLGNMWAQQWDNALPLYLPYPEVPFINITSEMLRQNYTVRKLFDLGDEYFKSLRMRPLPESFWNLSMLERPTDRRVVCHASAWDFFQDNDVRIKMCTEVNSHYFYVVHHELGHIQYYMQYEKQPAALRAGANPGFHEAVGDTIALSVGTARHLNSIGLLNVTQLDEKTRINELFRMALQKIVFLPFAYTLDKYRFAVFRNQIQQEHWNCAFWQMRSEFTGVEPPVQRTDADFDPPAKYHVDADVEYLRYFAAHIFQFQFHKAMCILDGQYVEDDDELTLDNCDIYGSRKAGEAFSKFLSAGASKHWKELLSEFTGETTMNPKALLDYFKPLYRWLAAENERLDVPLGWDITNKVAPDCCPLFST